ncbi:helix-turn-helix domain-containing protein [Microcoleus sp. AR_TQ3_B6]|uniref:helix-turn-helix domain-containing protein n=1 Tax=Microcoleus sp. AR_TQ3_B6 TaxID=3055284 RepID=UPI002FCFA67E
MALKPEAYFGVTDHATIEIPQENFRSVLSQIEAELLCSDTYSQALASLQTMLGSAASAAEILIRAVSREAVKLAFDLFPKENKIDLQLAQENWATVSPALGTEAEFTQLELPEPVPVFYWRSAIVESPAKTESDTENSAPESNNSEDSKQAPQDENKIESAAPETVTVSGKSFPGFGFPKKPKKLTKEEEAAKAVQQREECLRELGRELRKGRQIRSLSLQQLHSQTLVPLHHIEAIENGEIEKLPQDIYVRGFIRRLGDALGLDGSAMANALPKPAPSPIPSMYLSVSDSESAQSFQMRPVHLYIGYTALMAGAVGGLGWLSQQPLMPGAQAVPQTQVTPPASVAPAQKSQEKAPQPGLKQSSNDGRMIVGADMAPPEVIFG